MEKYYIGHSKNNIAQIIGKPIRGHNLIQEVFGIWGNVNTFVQLFLSPVLL